MPKGNGACLADAWLRHGPACELLGDGGHVGVGHAEFARHADAFTQDLVLQQQAFKFEALRSARSRYSRPWRRRCRSSRYRRRTSSGLKHTTASRNPGTVTPTVISWGSNDGGQVDVS